MKPIFVIKIAGNFIRIANGEMTLATHIQDSILVAVIEVHDLNLIQRVNDGKTPVASFFMFNGLVEWDSNESIFLREIMFDFTIKLMSRILRQ